MLNNINIMGRLCADPELRYTPNNVPVATFRIANDTGRKDYSGNRITRFVTCVAWRGRAEFASKYLRKGRLIVIEGELDIRDYTDRDGNKRNAAEVVVNNFHFADSKRSDDGDRQEAPPEYSEGGQFSELPDDDGDLPF